MEGKMFIAAAVAATMMCACSAPKGPQTVAHRGYWDIEGSAQNSIESLRQAGGHGFYGSEFDVYATPDGEFVINHDDMFHGMDLYTTPYEEYRDSTLSNGEKISTLDQYLAEFRKYPKLQLVFELKSKGDPEYEARAIPGILAKLDEYGLAGRTDFICFSLTACQAVAKARPEMMVEYLNGDLSPAELAPMGIRGIDYHISVFQNHPEWVEEAHGLGMTVNVWTVNDEEDINEMLALGVDYITTNAPELSEALIEKMADHQSS